MFLVLRCEQLSISVLVSQYLPFVEHGWRW